MKYLKSMAWRREMKDLTPEQIKDKLDADVKTLDDIRKQLFTMANSYTGDMYGYIAQTLHQSNNCCVTAAHKMIVEAVRIPVTRQEQTEIVTKKALDIQHANYEEYSYYVCTELNSGRTPKHFGIWVAARNDMINDLDTDSKVFDNECIS